VLLYVDNQAIIHAWHKRMSPHCELVSIIVQCLHLLEAILPCRIYVEYVPRCSSPSSVLADKLSRQSTTDKQALKAISHLTPCVPGGPLIHWLGNPDPNWDFPRKLAEYVQNLVQPTPP
jgi:hypothetical protein